MTKQIRIAFIVDYLVDASFQDEAIKGVIGALPDKGVQLFIFLGGDIKSSPIDPYTQYRNFIYELIGKEMFDAIVVSGTIGSYIPIAEFAAYLQQYDGIPIIFIGPGPEKYSQILVDNRKGMEEIVQHFIRDHQFKKIAFVSGPQGNKDAEERLAVYKQQLAQAGLPWDERLVFTGDFSAQSGVNAVKILLDERKVAFEALIAANDNMALGAKQELESRGHTIPEYAALAGFDDIAAASSVLPSLTTVRQPFNQFGARIFANLSKMIDGSQEQKIEYIQTEKVIRQSCGCLAGYITDEKLKYNENSETDTAAFYHAHKAQYVKELGDNLMRLGLKYTENQVKELVTAFHAHIFSPDGHPAFTALKKALMQSIKNGENVDSWQEALTYIRHLLSPLLADRQIIDRAENLFHQSRLIINDIQITQNNRNLIQTRNQFEQVLAVGDALAVAMENRELRNVIYTTLPVLNIKNFLFAELVPDEFGQESTKKSKLIALIRDGKEQKPEENEIIYPTAGMFPEGLKAYTPRINFVLPLTYREQRLGYVIFEKFEAHATSYTALAGQLARSLYTSKLMKRLLTTENEIRKRSDNIEALVLPMIESIQQVKILCESQSGEAINLTAMGAQSSEKIQESIKITDNLAKMLSETSLLADSINDISETVDVLSLNAAIEAVHAGTWGRGFSVIAAEIRKLSDKTKQNVGQVTGFLSSISGGINKFVGSNKEAGLGFNKLHDAIKSITASLNEVSVKMIGLSDASNTILQVMRRDG